MDRFSPQSAWNRYVNERGINRREIHDGTVWARHLSFGVPRAVKHIWASKGELSFKNSGNDYLRKTAIREELNNKIPREPLKEAFDIEVVSQDEQALRTVDDSIQVRASIDYVYVKNGRRIVMFFDNFGNGAFSYRDSDGINEHDKLTAIYWALVLGDVDGVHIAYYNRDKNSMIEERINLDSSTKHKYEKQFMSEVRAVKAVLVGDKSIQDYELREDWMSNYSPFTT